MMTLMDEWPGESASLKAAKDRGFKEDKTCMSCLGSGGLWIWSMGSEPGEDGMVEEGWDECPECHGLGERP